MLRNRILPILFHSTKTILNTRYLLRFLVCRFQIYHLTSCSWSSTSNSSIECSKPVPLFRVLKLVFHVLLCLPLSLSFRIMWSKYDTLRILLLCIIFTFCFQFTWRSYTYNFQFLFGILSLQAVPAHGLANLISAYIVVILYLIMCNCSDGSKLKFGWITF